MRISDWSSDVGSADLVERPAQHAVHEERAFHHLGLPSKARAVAGQRPGIGAHFLELLEASEALARAQLRGIAYVVGGAASRQRVQRSIGGDGAVEIVSASCRERGCSYVLILVV